MGAHSKMKKTTEAWEKVMSRFTDDLWTKILLRLPIKSLLRFKSVSKSWFSIISSHRFAKSHLMTAATDDQVVIIHQTHDGSETDFDGSFSLFHLGSGRVFKNLKFPYSQGEYPSNYLCSKIVGSDCGIVCVAVDVFNWHAAKNKYDIYLWNPATRHSKLLPPCIIPGNRLTDGILGFGFDYIDLDFKVVRAADDAISAEVYSSNRNGWRTIESKPIDIPHMFDLCFHGFLFAAEGNRGMMAFNLHKDLFIWNINLPPSAYNGGFIQTLAIDFKATIAVAIYNLFKGKLELWTLDDEACLCGGGVDASWTKVITHDVGQYLDFVGGVFNNVQLLVLDSLVNVCFYDLMNNKVTSNVTVPGNFVETSEVFKYIKSLYSLEGFKRIKWAASSSRLQDLSDCDVEMDE